MKLILFDIDGTILRSGGAGRAAMVEAMERLHGRPDAFDGTSFAGAVDPGLVGEALRRVGIEASSEQIGRVRSVYLRALRRRMAVAGREGRVQICRGADAAVGLLAERAAVGLMTGNWRRGARIKLDHIGLWSAFEGGVGAYGDDAAERDALLPFAWRRAARRGVRATRVLVIGDTPNDVRAARAGGLALRDQGVDVRSVAVRTGFATHEELLASQPDLLIDDLAVGMPEVLALLEG